jgi:hypothetical protein
MFKLYNRNINKLIRNSHRNKCLKCESRCVIRDSVPAYKLFIPMYRPKVLVNEEFLSLIKIEPYDSPKIIQEKADVLEYFSKRMYNDVTIWCPYYSKGQLFRMSVALFPAIYLILVTDGILLAPCGIYIALYIFFLGQTWNEIEMHNRYLYLIDCKYV